MVGTNVQLYLFIYDDCKTLETVGKLILKPMIILHDYKLQLTQLRSTSAIVNLCAKCAVIFNQNNMIQIFKDVIARKHAKSTRWFADGDGMRISMQTMSRITFFPLLVCEKNRRPASTVDKLATNPMMLSTNLVSSVSVIGKRNVTMTLATKYNSMTSPLALLQLILFITFSSSEAASTGSSSSKTPALVRTSVMHPAFESAGKSAGLKIWRIEDFEPVPYPVKDYGKFFTGDSYIVLNSVKGKNDKLSSDIFYWSGSTSSQDEVGAAAILSIQLDDALGGSPVQHKETQDHESQAFLSLFTPSIRYMPGGIASGFHHAEINAGGEKKLYQVKGKKNIRVKQIEPKVTSMNQGDCFILDTGKEILVYVGPQAKGTERLKAINVANQVRDQDHSGRAKVNIVDGSSTPDEFEKFFKELGSGSAKQVPAAIDDDQEFEKKETASPVLYKISDSQGGKIVSEKIDQKPLVQSHLKTDDCFILDTVSSGIYVWVGKKGTTQEKVESLKRAQVFIKENNYPAWTRVIRVIEGGEPTAFKQYFENWKDNGSRTRL